MFIDYGMIIIAGLMIAILLAFGHVYSSTMSIKTEGFLISKRYEPIQDRFYLVIEINSHDVFRDYLEFTLSKEEWLSYNDGDKLECQVEFNQYNSIIKSVKKYDS